jgi:hypothetical protein
MNSFCSFDRFSSQLPVLIFESFCGIAGAFRIYKFCVLMERHEGEYYYV